MDQFLKRINSNGDILGVSSNVKIDENEENREGIIMIQKKV